MDTAAAFEFEAADVQRRQREHQEVVPPSSAAAAADSSAASGHGSADTDGFMVHLNPFGRGRSTSVSTSTSTAVDVPPPPLAVKYIDDEQEARAVADLSAGLLTNLHTPLQRLEEHLLELHRNQQLIITGLLHENEKLANLPHWHEIAEVMSRAPTYHQRLHNMRTQMADLSGRVQRLKTRSAKLKQRKIAVEEKERQLTAQPAASLLMRRAGGDNATAATASPESSGASAKGKNRI